MKKALQILKAYQSGTPMVWNDPQPIDGNDYTINLIIGLENIITDISSGELDEDDAIILIHYGGGSEAEVYLSEITIMETPKTWLNLSLLEIIAEYKDGSEDEPLDGDAVEDLIRIIKAKINLNEGNITEEEYERILNNTESMTLTIGDAVEVADPTDSSDAWIHSFVGYIEYIDEEQKLCGVMDGDGNMWDVEIYKVTKVED